MTLGIVQPSLTSAENGLGSVGELGDLAQRTSRDVLLCGKGEQAGALLRVSEAPA